jgi:osmotically-inducible protein OsmY
MNMATTRLNHAASATLLCAALGCTTLLAGCPAVLLVGAGTGVVSASDRRTTGAQLDDQGIELRAGQRLKETLGDKAGGMSVASYNRRVLIYGQAPDEASRKRAQDVVVGTANVRDTINDVEIAGNTSFSTHASDALVASKVRASLLNAAGVPSSSINVTVERGVTYLQGLVSETEADRAAKVAAGVDGVVRVVKVFEFLTPADIDRLTRTQASGSSGSGQK